LVWLPIDMSPAASTVSESATRPEFTTTLPLSPYRLTSPSVPWKLRFSASPRIRTSLPLPLVTSEAVLWSPRWLPAWFRSIPVAALSVKLVPSWIVPPVCRIAPLVELRLSA